uniref:Uncharacterized protein n=1 Tax=Arundo donax TaxID=35708 RepID=A0A0A9GJW9_ARUDO
MENKAISQNTCLHSLQQLLGKHKDVKYAMQRLNHAPLDMITCSDHNDRGNSNRKSRALIIMIGAIQIGN